MPQGWFVLNVDFTAALSEFILSLVIFLYFQNLKDRSRDTNLFRYFIMCWTVYLLASSVSSLINPFSSLKNVFAAVHLAAMALSATNQFWFAYRLGEDMFKQEKYFVVTLISICTIGIVARFISNPSLNLLYFFYFIMSIWYTIIYYRKYRLATNQRKQNLYKLFIRYGLIENAIWIVVNLGFSGYLIGVKLPGLLVKYFFHSCVLLAITYASIVFLNYASDKTSFQAKLVGVVLCAILFLLGLSPMVLTSLIETLPGHESFVQRMLLGMTILIPVTSLMVVFGLPLLFRYGLLITLNRIVAGIQKINAGDLSAEVQVEVNDEVGQLALQFNQMTGSLRQYANDMESLVAQRTQELNATLENLKATQAQLIQREKLASLGELTAGIAHEIQNPLNFVNNFAEVSAEMALEMKEEMDKGETEEAKLIADDLILNLQKINHHGKRASSIVKNMLEHSRSSTGEKALTNLNTLLDECLRLSYHGMRAQEKDFQAEYSLDLEADLPEVVVVAQDISRVLLNLFNNAFYEVYKKRRQLPAETAYAPKVSASTRKTEQSIEIRISDNGSGIQEAIRDKIFQPFFTTKPTGEGTGLGLSLAYDIITKGHGGSLALDAQPSEGSIFIINLPL